MAPMYVVAAWLTPYSFFFLICCSPRYRVHVVGGRRGLRDRVRRLCGGQGAAEGPQLARSGVAAHQVLEELGGYRLGRVGVGEVRPGVGLAGLAAAQVHAGTGVALRARDDVDLKGPLLLPSALLYAACGIDVRRQQVHGADLLACLAVSRAGLDELLPFGLGLQRPCAIRQDAADDQLMEEFPALLLRPVVELSHGRLFGGPLRLGAVLRRSAAFAALLSAVRHHALGAHVDIGPACGAEAAARGELPQNRALARGLRGRLDDRHHSTSSSARSSPSSSSIRSSTSTPRSRLR
jgi:hypothetical protein